MIHSTDYIYAIKAHDLEHELEFLVRTYRTYVPDNTGTWYQTRCHEFVSSPMDFFSPFSRNCKIDYALIMTARLLLCRVCFDSFCRLYLCNQGSRSRTLDWAGFWLEHTARTYLTTRVLVIEQDVMSLCHQHYIS